VPRHEGLIATVILTGAAQRAEPERFRP
jgi:hypothetical protein